MIIFWKFPVLSGYLKIQAFWDIFYEHCTYMSPGSLARLFRLNGFEVLDMYLEYDDQYLFIEAKPVKEISSKNSSAGRKSVEELKALTKILLRRSISAWRMAEKLDGFKEEGKKVVIWGGGSKSVGFLTQFDDLGVIEHVVDINPHMQGNYIPGIGKQYVGPDFLTDYKPDVVIVMNSVYMEEIRKMLNERGLDPHLLGL